MNEGFEGAFQNFMMSMSDIVDNVMSLVVDVANTVMNSPILLMTTGLLLLGGAIGIFGRLLSRG